MADWGGVEYPSDMTVRAARERYFQVNGFSPQYDTRWVKLKAGPLSLYFPNSKARIRAVKLHDLHHIATEYQTTWIGEAEIGAWELGAGCGRHIPAWILDFAATLIGLFLSPRRVFRAFRRGRRSRSLLVGEFDEKLLELSVGELRERLLLAGGDSGKRLR